MYTRLDSSSSKLSSQSIHASTNTPHFILTIPDVTSKPIIQRVHVAHYFPLLIDRRSLGQPVLLQNHICQQSLSCLGSWHTRKRSNISWNGGRGPGGIYLSKVSIMYLPFPRRDSLASDRWGQTSAEVPQVEAHPTSKQVSILHK